VVFSVVLIGDLWVFESRVFFHFLGEGRRGCYVHGRGRREGSELWEGGGVFVLFDFFWCGVCVVGGGRGIVFGFREVGVAELRF